MPVLDPEAAAQNYIGEANAELVYMYRDGDNYKNVGTVIFANPEKLDLAEATERISARLDDGVNFVASQIGVPEIFLWSAEADYDPDDPDTYPANLGSGNYVINDDADHGWHEFFDLRQTSAPVTDRRTLATFVQEVEGVTNWNPPTPVKGTATT